MKLDELDQAKPNVILLLGGTFRRLGNLITHSQFPFFGNILYPYLLYFIKGC